jgi:ribosomal protein S18 acetylase RimI-like enzyme
VNIRAATADDSDRIADLHVTVWRATYRDLAPAAAFAALDQALRRRRWAEHFASPAPGTAVLVAERDGAMLGFGYAGPATLPALGPRGEFKSLYVSTAHQGHGAGRRLMAAMARHLQSVGFSSGALGVVRGNHPAIEFYRRLGGRHAGDYLDPGPVWRSDNLVYVWDDLGLLA